MAISLRVKISIIPKMDANVPKPTTHFQIFLKTVPIKCYASNPIVLFIVGLSPQPTLVSNLFSLWGDRHCSFESVAQVIYVAKIDLILLSSEF